VSDRCPPATRDAVERMIRAQSPEGCAAAVRGMALRPASHDVLSRFAGPSLVVVGEQDVITPPAKAQELAKLLQGSKLVGGPGAGARGAPGGAGPGQRGGGVFPGAPPRRVLQRGTMRGAWWKLSETTICPPGRTATPASAGRSDASAAPSAVPDRPDPAMV